MTKPTEATPEALASELESLRAHNAELLADLRKAKDSAKDAQAALQAAETARDEAHDRYQRAALRVPVERLTDSETLDGPFFRDLFARHYTFALDADDRVVIHDLDGNPATVPDKEGKTERPAAFTRDDIVALCAKTPATAMFDRVLIGSRASGGGASGSKGLHAALPKPDAGNASKAPSSEFCLR